MNEIEIKSLIDKSKLDNKEYFISLLNQGVYIGLINEQQLLAIQNGCLLLLKEKIIKSNGEFSSSIRIEKAQDWFTSITYILGLALKASSPDEAIRKLQKTNVEDLYRYGLKRATFLLKSSRLLYSKILENHININNIYYNSVIYKQIRFCLKKYNYEMSSNEIPINLEYPLCNPINDLIGIEYISKYIQSLCYENAFCCRFSSENINRILSNYSTNFHEIPVNIFKQTLIVALGCIIAKINPADLYISTFDFEKIFAVFEKNSVENISVILNESIITLFHTLKIVKTSSQEYIKSCLPTIGKELYLFARLNKLQSYFMVEKSLNDSETYFCYNDRMNQGEYQKLKNTLIQIKNPKERSNLIINNLNSIEDFLEMIHESIITPNEIECIIGAMDIFSLAILFDRISAILDLDLLYIEVIDKINKKIDSLNNSQLELFKDILDILKKIKYDN